MQEFMDAYGENAAGTSKREDQGEEGRFRKFTREEIKAKDDNLDISWLHDDSVERAEDLPDPDELAAEMFVELKIAFEALEELMEGAE